MTKKVIEDVKSKGVKVTAISRGEISTRTKKNNLKEGEDYFMHIEKEVEKEDPKNFARAKAFNKSPVLKGPVRPRAKHKKWLIWGGVVFVLIFAYIVSNLFENTRITVEKKAQSLVLDKESFQATLKTSNPIAFELMIVSDSQMRAVTLSETETVSTKAQGEITLYNEYSTKAQNLLVRTFLSDENGKSYVTDKATTIPGYTLSKTKEIIPGKVTVGISSFIAGEAYNGSPKDFTINGFKGTAKFKKIYAKLKSPLEGGAKGLFYKPSPQEMGTLGGVAASLFRSDLLKKANAQVPPGYLLYSNALTVTTAAPENILSKTPEANVKLEGTVSAVLLKKDDLIQAIIGRLLPETTDLERTEIAIQDIGSLEFRFSNPGQLITKDVGSVPFTLTGTINPIWHPDTEALARRLLGISKSDFSSVFTVDPGIASATMRVFPPWKSHLPKNPAKIHIRFK